MNLHKLLQKQVKKHLPAHLLQSEEMETFLCAISDSYAAYEKDSELADRAFRITEDDYVEINNKLKYEIDIKQKSLYKLRETVGVLSDNTVTSDTDDLLMIADYLNKEVSHRKNAEKTLSLLITNIQSGVLLEDENGIITFANNLFCKMFDINNPAENIIGKSRIDIAKNKSEILKEHAAYIEKSKKTQAEKKLTSGEVMELTNGKIFEWDFIPIFLEDEYKGNLCTYKDVTEKKRTQEIIRTALERIGDNVWEHDYTTGITTFSKPDIEMISYKAGNSTKPSDLWMEHVHPDDKHILVRLDKQYRSGEINDHEEEYRMINDEGILHWVLDRGLMIERAPDGIALKTLGTHTDITKIKETEWALRESEQSFRSIAENVPGLIYKYLYKKRKGSFSYISPNAEEKINITEEQLTNFYKIIHPDDYEREREMRRQTIGQNIPYHFEGRFIVPGKPVIWLCISSSLTRASTDGTLVYTGIITNITKEKEAEHALQVREEKYRNILANMNLGLMEVDNKDVIRSVNHSFCEMSGYTEGELVGKKAAPLFLKGDNVFLMKEKNSLRTNGYSDVYEMMVENKKGEPKWWLISGAPSFNDAGVMIGSIGIHLDITDQKRTQTDLIKARKQAEESAKSKQVFLANMSHEIRTPMNAIIGMSRQLSKTILDTRQRVFLETIHSAADNLLVVINDVLDLSKMEAGKLNIEAIGFNLYDVLNRAINVVDHKAEEKGLQLKISELNHDISEVLLGDPYRINQILLNLLSNAVKFTERGSITVSCNVLKNAEHSQTIRISVEDTGIGMEEEFADKIFEAFNQEYNSNTRKYGGTGLGMHICKQLIEMMGGSIEVKSKKGVGTRITFTIEYPKGVQADLHSKEILPFEASKLSRKRILVADDNEMNRFLLSVILQNYNSIVIEAKNGREAVEIVREKEVDIVLMDIQMPLMDGTQATRLIRNELKSNVPIIALTANAIKGYHEEYLQSGMNAYVLKPFNEDDLLRTVIKWLGNDQDSEVPVVAKPTAYTENIDKLYDLTQLIEISRDNDAFVTKMIGLFIVQAQTFITEITEAIQYKDFEKMAAVAHRFKPGVSNICKPFVFDEIKNLEQLVLQNVPLEKVKEVAAGFLINLKKVMRQLEDELSTVAAENTEVHY